MIDIQSCLNYYAVEIYVGNTDWPDKNEAAWRSKNAGKAEKEDGKMEMDAL